MAEILGAIGLILPAVLHVAPVLVPLAAVGLILVMLGAAVVHARRHELCTQCRSHHRVADTGRRRGMGSLRAILFWRLTGGGTAALLHSVVLPVTPLLIHEEVMDELLAADEPGRAGQLDEHLDDVALHTEYRRLVAEQAAARRLGTLVARAAPEPSEVIGAVAEEMRQSVDAITAGLWRFDTSGEITLVAAAAHPAALAKWPLASLASIPFS